MMNDSYQRSNQQESAILYTHQLPYGVRRKFCQLLDADHSWKTLGGQYFGQNDTDLTLIGQASMRPLGSPTEELLKKFDSANIRVASLSQILKSMNHHRACEILQSSMHPRDFQNNHYEMIKTPSDTLNTPTHSFMEQTPQQTIQQNQFMALMGANDEVNHLYEENQLILNGDAGAQWQNQMQYDQYQPQQQSQPPQRPVKCHRDEEEAQVQDPGEEIVRLACANNRKRTSISDQEVVNQLRLIMQINYNELKLASNDFSDSNVLGNGGFASVYRGNWKGTDVAIKRLKCNLMDQALNELTILNSYRIDNILPIYGISIDGPEACLVYQFMANGSLEDRLSCKKDTKPLTWKQRAMIGEGVAKGLYYLHTLRDKPLVHGDVKSANVLLDSQFVPKLGDFGLARQVFKGKNPQTELCTHCTVSSIHGTSVYLPPEYLRHKILSPAVDVYSYGIMLLEMATGRRAFDGKQLLIDMVDDELQSAPQGQISLNLKDPRLEENTGDDLKIWCELLMKLGLNCAHKIKKKRPDMGNVLRKFVEFRNVTRNTHDLSDASALNNNHLFGHQSTRTLTPELSQFQDQPHLLPRLNSNLMSVEEVEEFGLVEPTNKIESTDCRTNGEVETMIPLLTELGLKQE